MPEKKLFLLDAMALIYRAYFALNKNPRINSKGLNTSAILGFANTLFDLIQKEKPTHIGVAFDSYAPTLRHDAFASYKANRDALPEDIGTSLPYIRELLGAFRIPVLMMDGYEADDIIGTLAKKAEQEGFTTFMVTPDKDFCQLVSENIRLYKPGRSGEQAEILGVDEVCKRFGIENPDQVRDILGLWGDASDNIPGIPGIGEKRSQELIARYGSVEEVIAHADELAGKLRENVQAFADQGRQSKELATIITDVPIEWEEAALQLQPPDVPRLKILLNELEFRTFARRVFENMPVVTPTAGVQTDLFGQSGSATSVKAHMTLDTSNIRYQAIQDTPTLMALIRQIVSAGAFCFDTETSGLDVHQSELVGIAFALKPYEAWYLPVPADRHEALALLEPLRPVFENDQILKIGQNIKFDISVLRWYGIDVQGPLFDTMIAHYLLEPDLRHNMDYLAEEYLGYTPVSIESLIGKKGAGQLSMRDVPLEKITPYACEDADVTLRLKQIFEPRLAETGTDTLFSEIEMPLVSVLSGMESEGVKLDIPALEAYSIELQTDIQRVEQEIYTLSGMNFNIASPKQLGEVLYKRLRITDKPSMTKTRQFSTSEDVLSKLSNTHPVIDKILDYRSLTKLKSTYVDALPNLINPKTGRIHTSYNQAVASTGRLSSNNPNLQNIPIRTERGREIRRAFIPRNDDHVLVAADYSQIELRLIAHMSGDANMQQAFREGKDIHTTTAARIHGVPEAEVKREMRSRAKEVNFGIIYGMSAFGLAERLQIPRQEAADIIQEYFRQYPGIKLFMDNQIATARKLGYVETIMKRRRYLRDINSSNGAVRGMAERNAINAPIQGSSADMIKVAMIRIYEALRHRGMASRMILQVHDELVFDVPSNELRQIMDMVPSLMRDAIPLAIPVVVDIKSGNNWLEAH